MITEEKLNSADTILSKVLTFNGKSCLFFALNLTDWQCQLKLMEKLAAMDYQASDDTEADAENIIRNLENNYESNIEHGNFDMEAEIHAVIEKINSQIKEIQPDCVFIDCISRIQEDETRITKNIASKLGEVAKENGINIFFYSRLFGEYRNLWLHP